MPRTELIDELIRDGVIIAHYDTRSNSLRPLFGTNSGTPANVTANSVRIGKGYVEVGGADDALDVPTSASWQAANNGSLIMFGDYDWVINKRFCLYGAFPRLLLEWLGTPGNMRIRTSGGNRSFLGFREGPYKTIAIDFWSTDVAPKLYLDGEYAVDANGTAAVTLDSLTFKPGWRQDNTVNRHKGFIWTNQRMTAVQHRQIHRELMA